MSARYFVARLATSRLPVVQIIRACVLAYVCACVCVRACVRACMPVVQITRTKCSCETVVLHFVMTLGAVVSSASFGVRIGQAANARRETVEKASSRIIRIHNAVSELPSHFVHSLPLRAHPEAQSPQATPEYLDTSEVA